MNILVLRLSALGDVAMTVPAVYSVARAFPQHRFYVVTSAFPARLFINVPSNIFVVALSKRESQGPLAVFRLLKRLRQLPIDAVADLHNVLRSWCIDAYYRLHIKPVAMLDKRRSERRSILHDHAFAARPFTARYFDVFARLGLLTEPHFTTLFSNGLPALPSGLPAKGTEQWIGVAPFARYRSKTYDAAQMQEVVAELAARPRGYVFLFGARGREEKTLKTWAARMHNVFVVAGRLQLEEELALMAHLDIMISMDSANMHLASLVGTRVISLWGGTTPSCGFLGYHQRKEDALSAGLSCQPCTIAGSDSCPLKHMQCTRALLPQTIIAHIQSTEL